MGIQSEGMGLLAQIGSGPLVGSCEHGNESLFTQKAGNSLISCATINLSRRTLLNGDS